VGFMFFQQIDDRLLALRHRLQLLRWLVPVTMALLVVAYEALPGPWLLAHYGLGVHTAVEILLFGTFGPLLAFIVLDFFGRWIDERDTSDLQARLMAEARADVTRSRALCDDAVQALFSAGTLISVLQAEAETHGAPESGVQIAATQEKLDEMVATLRAHLEETPRWAGNGKL
jgi:hypothetical protein